MAMSTKVTITAVDHLTRPLKGMGNALNSLKANAAIAGPAMAAVGVAVLAVATKSVQAAMVQEEAIDRLTKIYGEGTEALLEFASAMQKQTQFGDELIINTMAIGATYKNLKPVMQEATKTALNMAQAYGMDVVQAMHLLGKASAGQVGQLSRYGIIVDKAKVKAEGMTAVFEAITKETKNVAFTSESATKSLEQMKNAIGDTAEAVGFALLPVLTDAAPKVQALAEGMSDASQTPFGAAVIQLTVGLGALAIPLGGILMMLPSLSAGFAILTGAAAATAAAVVLPYALAIGAITGIGLAITKLVGMFQEAGKAGKQLDEDLAEGIATSDEAVAAMRKRLDELVQVARDRQSDMEDAGEGLADGLVRGLGGPTVASVAEGLQKNIAALTKDEARAKAEDGEGSRRALEAQNRLLKEQAKLYTLLMREAETHYNPLIGFYGEFTKQMLRNRGALVENTLELGKNESALAALGTETTKTTPEVVELTKEQKAATSAAEKAADAEYELARARDRNADALDDARDRADDALEAIGDAHENAAYRIDEAQRTVADAYRALEEAQASAKDANKTAEERAASEVERAQERIIKAKQRVADFKQPPSKAELHARREKELNAELIEANTALVEAKKTGQDDIDKARDEGVKRVDAANRAIIRSENNLVRVKKAAAKSIKKAYEDRADAVDELAKVETAALRTIEVAVRSLAAANEALAEAQGKVAGSGASAGGAGGAPTPAKFDTQSETPEEWLERNRGTEAPPAAPRPASAPALGNYQGPPRAAYLGGEAAGPGGGLIGAGQSQSQAPVNITVRHEPGTVVELMGSPEGRQQTTRIIKDWNLRR